MSRRRHVLKTVGDVQGRVIEDIVNSADGQVIGTWIDFMCCELVELVALINAASNVGGFGAAELDREVGEALPEFLGVLEAARKVKSPIKYSHARSSSAKLVKSGRA